MSEAPRSGVRNVPLQHPFESSASTIKNTTEEPCNITTQRAISNKAAQLHLAPSSSTEALPKTVI
jgi:hypothetical protein